MINSKQLKIKLAGLLFIVVLPFVSMTQTYRGVPIVPYPDSDRSNQNAIINQFGIGPTVQARTDALDFFNLMSSIAEPTTISTFSNYAINLKDYQKKPFLLDANIQVPIALGGKKWISNHSMMHTVHIIPQFKVRIFVNDENAPGSPNGSTRGDKSLPVRTPSYMPRITYYCSWRNQFRTPINATYDLPRVGSNFFGFSAFHHSNGQDGSEFYDDPSINVPNANYGDINVYNGNFGEQVAFELIYGRVIDFRSQRLIPVNTRSDSTLQDGFSISTTSNNIAQNYPYNRRWYYRTSIEIHWPDPLTNQEFLTHHLYGRFRLNFQSGLSWIPTYRDLVLGRNQITGERYFIQTTPNQSKESWRLVGNFQYILDNEYYDGNLISKQAVPYLDLRRLNIFASLFWRIKGSPNSALFLQAGYWGSDNYNIYFQEQIINLRFGIAFAFFKYPRLADFGR